MRLQTNTITVYTRSNLLQPFRPRLFFPRWVKYEGLRGTHKMVTSKIHTNGCTKVQSIKHFTSNDQNTVILLHKKAKHQKSPCVVYPVLGYGIT